MIGGNDVTQDPPQGRHAAPVSWTDAFPWLAGLSVDILPSNGAASWVAEPIDQPGMVRQARIRSIAAVLTSRLTNLSLGEALPTLPPSTSVATLPVTNRGRRMLSSKNCLVTGDIEELTPLDILDWRGMGAGTLEEIVQSLVSSAAKAASDGYARDSTLPSTVPRPMSDPLGHPKNRPQYVSDLMTLADWFAMLGLSGTPLMAGRLPDWAPAPTKDALNRLLKLTADDVEGVSSARADVASKLDGAMDTFDDRQLSVLSRRMFADHPVTLDQLGTEQGVTRERIRQIEAKARGSLLSQIAPGGALAEIASAVRQAIGQVTTLSQLLELMPSLSREVRAIGQPAWRVLDRIDDGYEIEDGWCVAPSLTATRSNTQTELQEQVDQYGVVRLDSIDLVETSRPERHSEVTAAWLASCGYIVDGDHVFTRTSSVADYAASILSIVGTPLASQEIIDRFTFERSAGSLRNAMSIDDRFERVDRDRWALTEWGLDAYAGIRSKIREQVALAGGRTHLNDLVEAITARYSVSASSVVAYASALPFETRDGIVQVADTAKAVRKTPKHTRRLFRRDHAWAYRVRISADHLRGSGSVAPMAIAGLLDLQFGETRQLESSLGPQAIAWTGNQPQFGTIRRFLMDGDIQADTEAFLVIGDDGTFTFEAARELIDNSLEDALTLVGAPVALDEATACSALAVAAGLPVTTPVTSIIAAYRERGDGDVADLLSNIREVLEADHSPERVAHSAEVDDILGLL